jgi:uncharacterized LabA/DUF88 family protein
VVNKILSFKEAFVRDKEKIAVFIDADNAPAQKIDKVLSELARYGVVNIRKAYGNWKNQNLKNQKKYISVCM